MNISDPLHCAIQDIRYAGEHPLVQFDILDAITLLNGLQSDGFYLNAHNLGKVLRALEMYPLGLHTVEGRRCHLWTCLPYQPLPNILATVRWRAKHNTTELHRELIVGDALYLSCPADPIVFTRTEYDILYLRLERRGLRYLRPREIAHRLGIHPSLVYAFSQKILKKIGLTSFKNRKAVLKAAHEIMMADF